MSSASQASRPGEGGGGDADLDGCVDDGADGGWQLVDVGDAGIGDEQEPLDRRFVRGRF